ncbi:MAG: RCC1 domain-containing protein [Actinomycetota bacterium]|nr:RCC1 domain-containing protein [Actinomycetota bacterium]
MTVVQDADEQRSAAAAAVAPGTVLAWGANDAGQLGDGMTNTSSTPVWVRNLTGVIWVSGGAQHCLAVQ